jgi:hypothetical protein
LKNRLAKLIVRGAKLVVRLAKLPARGDKLIVRLAKSVVRGAKLVVSLTKLGVRLAKLSVRGAKLSVRRAKLKGKLRIYDENEENAYFLSLFFKRKVTKRIVRFKGNFFLLVPHRKNHG